MQEHLQSIHQVCILKLSGQGQGHSIKKHVCVLFVGGLLRLFTKVFFPFLCLPPLWGEYVCKLWDFWCCLGQKSPNMTRSMWNLAQHRDPHTAKFDDNRCNVTPLPGEKQENCPMSNCNNASNKQDMYSCTGTYVTKGYLLNLKHLFNILVMVE